MIAPRWIATLGLLASASGAAAQAPWSALPGGPVEPATSARAVAAVAGLSPGGLTGLRYDLRAHAAWSPFPRLELGARAGVGGDQLRTADAAVGRFGPGPLVLSVGTGARTRRVAVGARLLGGLGLGAVGGERHDGGAADALAGVELALACDRGRARPRLTGSLALVRDVGIWAPAGGVALDVVLGRAGARALGVAGIEVALSREGAGARPGLGVAAWLGPGLRLDARVSVGLPGDPTGQVVGLALGFEWRPSTREVASGRAEP